MSCSLVQISLEDQKQLKEKNLFLEIQIEHETPQQSVTGLQRLENGTWVATAYAPAGDHIVRARFFDSETSLRSEWSNSVETHAPPRLVTEPPALLLDAAALITVAFLRWAKRPARGRASGGAARHGERSRSPKHLSGGRLRQFFAREKGSQ
ncbi:MAG: hypothetical protein CMQ40_12825 [Gammaproteobacteria bacterium]|nr:hypothetical protein [Gammaproteobacteria bacterium]